MMPATAVPSESSTAVSSNEDADLSAAFGPLFITMPKELLTKIVPSGEGGDALPGVEGSTVGAGGGEASGSREGERRKARGLRGWKSACAQ